MLSRNQFEELNSIFKRQLVKKYCLHPDAPEHCAGGIIKAHTIQKNGGISSIAKDGKVYVAKNDVMSIFNNSRKINIKLQGIDDATTFYGFCGKHDVEVFSPIEISDFVACDEHCFLLGYRALCKELYLKKAVTKILLECGKFIDFNKPEEYQPYVGRCRADNISMQEVSDIKKEYDSILKSRNYEDVNFLSIELRNASPVLCSSYISIANDMYKNTIQDPYGEKKTLYSLTFSVISRNGKGYVVFQWHKSANRIATHILQQFLIASHVAISRYIIGFIFLYAENFAFSPSWWDELPPDAKNMLLDFVNSNILTYKGLNSIKKWKFNSSIALKYVSTNFKPLHIAAAKINRDILHSN